MGNFGWGLRILATGGVNCSLANLGMLPLDAGVMLRSPPPPPPPALCTDGGNCGTYGEMSMATVSVGFAGGLSQRAIKYGNTKASRATVCTSSEFTHDPGCWRKSCQMSGTSTDFGSRCSLRPARNNQ